MLPKLMYVLVLLFFTSLPAGAEGSPSQIFPRLRDRSLETCRDIALARGSGIALAQARLAQARETLKDQQRRVKINTLGGFNPLDGNIRFYLSLDLERLLQMNSEARSRARQEVRAQSIGQQDARQETLRRVTAAWYALRHAEAEVGSAARHQQMTRALFAAADAHFRAGQGSLSSVLSSLQARREADSRYGHARDEVALACLSLAQSCGFATAESMEAGLR